MSFCVSGHPGVTSVCPSCELPCRLPAVSLARAPSSWIPADAGVLGKGQRAHLRLQSLEFRKKQDTSPRQWRLPSPWVAAWPSTPASVSLCRRCPRQEDSPRARTLLSLPGPRLPGLPGLVLRGRLRLDRHPRLPWTEVAHARFSSATAARLTTGDRQGGRADGADTAVWVTGPNRVSLLVTTVLTKAARPRRTQRY